MRRGAVGPADLQALQRCASRDAEVQRGQRAGEVTAAGLLLAFAMLGLTASTGGRAWLASHGVALNGFSGWREAASMLRAQHDWPELASGEIELLTGDFKLGAQMAFALGKPPLRVLDHPLNRRHGRAQQLRLWDLEADLSTPFKPGSRLLLLRDDGASWRGREAYYAWLCAEAGGLRLRQLLPVDGGNQRLVLFEQVPPEQGCQLPPG